jgi:hypothetical protein
MKQEPTFHIILEVMLIGHLVESVCNNSVVPTGLGCYLHVTQGLTTPDCAESTPATAKAAVAGDPGKTAQSGGPGTRLGYYL